MSLHNFQHRGLLMLCSSALCVNLAYAVDTGTVEITGKVSANTCLITPAIKNVTLPTIMTTALPNVGSTAGEISFDITLSGCSEGATTALPYFENSGSISAGGRLINTIAGATNVEVQLLTSSGALIDLSQAKGAQNIKAASISAYAGSISMRARYYATGTVGPGVFSSSINYTVDYN